MNLDEIRTSLKAFWTLNVFRLNLPHRTSNSVDDEEAVGSVDSAQLSEEEEDLQDLHDSRRRDSRMLRLQQGGPSPTPPTLARYIKGKLHLRWDSLLPE